MLNPKMYNFEKNSSSIEAFCGEKHFLLWDESHHNFGLCFQKSILCGISFAFFAVVSAFYIGKQTSLFIRSNSQKAFLGVRIAASVASLLLSVLLPCLLSFYAHLTIYWVDIFASFVQTFAWTVHLGYLLSLRCYLSRGTRGPRPVIAAWMMTLLFTILSAKTVWSMSENVFPKSTVEMSLVLYLLRVIVTIQLSLQLVYLVSLFPRGRCETGQSSNYLRIDEQTPLLDARYSNYSRFQETFDPFYLGVAEEGVNKLSYLTFHWVHLLMNKGSQKRLESVDDLYELPYALRSEAVSQKVQRQMLLSQPLPASTEEEEEEEGRAGEGEGGESPAPKYLLFKALHASFGARFYAIGVLKLVSVCLGFAGPLLLNVVVQFVEGKNEAVRPWMGYSAGVGICLFTLLTTFCTVHFNYLVSKINIQLRSSLVTSIFKKIQHLNVASLSQFSDGEVVNMMSTDTDRVVNFCQSFHELWSLPLQLTVTLFLLYTQVGIAFLGGLLFALLLIPVNKVIASKIADLSTRMMYFKDKRLSLTKDILSRIREVKLNSWENLFKKKVMDERYGELKALAGRKYLDAACVYFWACTPVLIPIITFGTFSLIGNPMEPAKIFTAVALFNMLMAPLNAFPWVVNGIVEAWVSLKRIERLLRMKDYRYDAYYTFLSDQEYRASDIQVMLLNASFSWHSKSKRSAARDGVGIPGSEEGARAASTEAESPSSVIHADLFGSGARGPRLTLRDVDIKFSKSHVTAIIGSVGSGKTALLYSLLGELEKVSGVIAVSGLHQGFGLATQKPWLQNMSIKDNIIFGQNFDPSRYRSVIHSCALEEDLKRFNSGEDTMCGENGSCLSGGQKARVALARAVYQNKNIYLLDDILSSVDGPVASQIMDRCIRGLLVGRTVVLVTHHTHLLSRVDWVVHLDEGKVKKQGPPSEVLPELKVADSSCFVECEPQSTAAAAGGAIPRNRAKRSRGKEKAPRQSSEPVLKVEERKPAVVEPVSCAAEPVPGSQETRSFGDIPCSIYSTYLSACGVAVVVLVFFSMVLMQASRNMVDLWLARWADHYDAPINSTRAPFSLHSEGGGSFGSYVWYPAHSVLGTYSSGLLDWNRDQEPSQVAESPNSWSWVERSVDPATKSYLTVYVGLAVTNTMFSLMRAFLFAYAGICAAKVLHKKLLDAVIYTKIGFFDLNPVGRILNRFSSDTYAIDDTLPFQANIFLAQLFGLLGALVVTVYGLPWIVLLYIPLMFIYYKLQHYYRHTSRDVRRIYALSLSPIYSHFTDTLRGLPVIRALRTSHRFSLQMDSYLDQNQKAKFGLVVASQWLDLRLQLIGVGILAGVILLALWEHHMNGVNPGLVGLVISYALTTNSFLNGVVVYLTETERELISVERVHQYLVETSGEGQSGFTAYLYGLSPPVAPPPPPPIALPFGWPTRGQIVFENAHLKYHDHNPYSLRNISVTIEPCEKVGIVGRTGAGKSSLLMALFRLVELSRGKIFIDNVDISEISLKKLRTSMAIVSQDVLLFTGTVRENLDPRSENLDREIEHAIEQCHLSSVVSDLGGLDGAMDAGRELSAGQRQLICLARALLSRAKIVCLDEGTSLLDSETEARVQSVLREAFRGKTVLVISHRLHAVRDCHRVIVLSDGEIAEIGRPMDLIDDKNSVFFSIINSQKEN